MNKQERIESLLIKMTTLQHFDVQEPTIFSIGSRGYYENPTTDILAFFIDDSAQHGLGPLVLEGLAEALPEKWRKIDCSLSSIPEREVVTKAGKRIDLLLENQEWVMVIENKIFHEQNNPFQEYENFVFEENVERFSAKEAIFVVLSPSGGVPIKHPGWVGVSYPKLINAIKPRLADHFMSQPLCKWLVLLREFILHLENIMSKESVPTESINFVLENLAQIKEAQDLKDKSIKSYQKSLHQKLQVEFETELNSKIVHWHGYPAIRFAFKNWSTDSDVVLFLDARDGKVFCINYYSSNIINDAQREIADKHFKELDCGKPWDEASDTCRCYKARFEPVSDEVLKLEDIQFKLAQKLRLMDEFEMKIRPSLNR